MRVGVEVGGTFTDLVMLQDGRTTIAKVASTPQQPEIGVFHAIAAAGIKVADIDDLVHGSTVATNAVLERKGGRVGVLLTAGTRDLLHLQRQDRRAIYDLKYRKPQPVCASDDIGEIDERLAPDGTVVVALDAARLDRTITDFLARGPFDAIAICLLHSYANPSHERQVAAAIARHAPKLPVSCSCDVSAEFREYERATTTTLAAYVQPVIAGYLQRMIRQLDGQGFTGRTSIMQSNGGRMPAAGMAKNAITGLFSGPAAGVVGALGVANQSGLENIITLDMGGTSTDVALVANGRPTLSPQTVIDGLPVRTPVTDIATVGAGGGSLVWVDDGGLLRAGPRSAGAQPGPACYQRGGTEATITDAHLVRGTLQAGSFLAGTMTLDREAARQSLKAPARQLDMTIEQLADSAIRVAEGNIVRAIQQVSTERGHDPRDFALVPFGGAGPLHAARVAEDLGINTILVPRNAGVLSAGGLLMSDYVHYRSLTRRVILEEASVPTIRETLQSLRDEVSEYLRSLDIHNPARFEHLAEMRYVGQAFELSVHVPGQLSSLTASDIHNAFKEAHQQVFEFSKPPDNAVEIVSFRVGAHVASDAFPYNSSEQTNACADRNTVQLTEHGDTLNCDLLTRSQLSTDSIAGPILIEDGSSTIWVPAGWTVYRDASDNLIMQRDSQ